MGVELDAERLGEIGGELLVAVGLDAAQAMVEVGGVEDEAQFCGASGERPSQSYGISSAGETDGEAQPGLEQGCVERN